MMTLPEKVNFLPFFVQRKVYDGFEIYKLQNKVNA